MTPAGVVPLGSISLSRQPAVTANCQRRESQMARLLLIRHSLYSSFA